MRWFLVDKTLTAQPADGTYKTWKPLIRQEGRNQCCYCAIHEAQFGGMRNFHVEHYRPKKKYPELENVVNNLFYSCSICNTFKGSSWTGEPLDDHTRAAFPCPSVADYSEILSYKPPSYELTSNHVAGNFLIERLNLNRAQLIFQRHFVDIYRRIELQAERLQLILRDGDGLPKELITEAFERNLRVTTLMAEARALVPYEAEDVQR